VVSSRLIISLQVLSTRSFSFPPPLVLANGALLISLFAAGNAAGDPGPEGGSAAGAARGASTMTEPVKGEALANRLRIANQNDPVRKVGPRAGEAKDPAPRFTGRDLVKESAVLSRGALMALVPKRAVLHLPDSLKDSTGVKEGSTLVSWQEFLKSNRSWIRTVEVSRERATGKKPFSAEEAEALRSSGRVVVATFQGGPIAVLPSSFPESVSPEPGKETN